MRRHGTPSNLRRPLSGSVRFGWLLPGSIPVIIVRYPSDLEHSSEETVLNRGGNTLWNQRANHTTKADYDLAYRQRRALLVREAVALTRTLEK